MKLVDAGDCLTQTSKDILQAGGEPATMLCVNSGNATKQMLFTCKHCGSWDWLSRILRKSRDEEKTCRKCKEIIPLEVYKLDVIAGLMEDESRRKERPSSSSSSSEEEQGSDE